MPPDRARLEAFLGDALGVALRIEVAREALAPSRLTARERARFESLAGTPRAGDWLLGRCALKRLRAGVDGCEETSDIAFPHPRFSLTHSHGVAMAIGDASNALDGLGVDLEIGAHMRAQAARFFLTPGERRRLDAAVPDRRRGLLLRAWCVKEAVFKANRENAGTLLADHEIACLDAARGEARFGRYRTFEYASWCEDGACVAVAISRGG